MILTAISTRKRGVTCKHLVKWGILARECVLEQDF